MSKTSNRSLVAVAAVSAIGSGLAGCASTTPTREISQGYAIFDVKGEIAPAKAAEAIKVALQKSMTGIQISNGLPPSPLPDKPARFQLESPFKAGSGIAALAASSGQAIQVPTCEGAILTADGRDGDHHVGGFGRVGRIQALAHPGRSAGAVNDLCDVESAV